MAGDSRANPVFRTTVGLIALAVSVVGCGTTPDDAAPSTTTTTATTTTAVATSTTTTTTTSTTTTAAPPPSWPEELRSTELLDAYAIAEAWPLTQVTLSQSTSLLLADGTTNEGEGIDLRETWEGEHVQGHASFRGRETITIARASGNAELAEIMLGDGIDYVVDGGFLYLPRHVATTLHEDITRSGSEWVSIDLNGLDTSEAFVAGLLAPFSAARLRPTDDGEDPVHQLRFATDDRGTYELETDTVSQTVELDTDGALRTLEVRATFVLAGAPAVRSLDLSYDSFDGEFTAMTPTEADDITREFKDYVAGRATAILTG